MRWTFVSSLLQLLPPLLCTLFACKFTYFFMRSTLFPGPGFSFVLQTLYLVEFCFCVACSSCHLVSLVNSDHVSPLVTSSVRLYHAGLRHDITCCLFNFLIACSFPSLHVCIMEYASLNFLLIRKFLFSFCIWSDYFNSTLVDLVLRFFPLGLVLRIESHRFRIISFRHCIMMHDIFKLGLLF